MLRRDLTEQNADSETHRRRGYVANLCVDVLRSKKRGRRGVTLEDPESVSLKKVCRSYARICARYPPLARLSGRNTKNRDRNVKCHAGKDFSEFRLDAIVVKIVLGQLTESRSPNEDTL